MTQVTLDQAMQIAVQHHQAGRFQEAEQLYRQIMAQRPEYAPAIHHLGLIAHQMGRNDIAIDLIRRAIALRPNYPEALSNLGNVLQDKGQLDEAVAAYRQALAFRPNYPGAQSNLGVALKDMGRFDEAIAAYRQSIVLMPNCADAHNNLGAALTQKGQLREAIDACRQAIALRPNNPEAHNNLGNALKDKGQLEEAIDAYRQAIALRPSLPDAHNNLGNALKDKGQLNEAIDACRHAIVLRPNYSDAYNNLGNILKDKGQLDEAIAAYRQAIALRPTYSEAHSNLVYFLYFHPVYDAHPMAEEHRRWNLQHAEPLRGMIRSSGNDRDPDRRLRIGYVSPDFRGHVVGRWVLPIVEHHDHGQFQIFCYSDVRHPDLLTDRFRAHADHWRNIVGRSDEHVARLVREDGIDILVDLTMHMAHNRMLLFARKPAPVQVTWLAYPGTTGMEVMDYRLTDRYLDPVDDAEAGQQYSEESIRLPDCWCCYRPSGDAPSINELPAQAAGQVTFACLNNFCKVSVQALKCWCELLRSVPGSRLLLHANEGSHRQGVRDLLAREGIDPGRRLGFVALLPELQYLCLHHQIDIGLDPFPYSGGTTSCDALWMGVPVVTLSGRTAVGRGTATVLHNIGLAELVADSQEQYVQIAKGLAVDLPRLSQMRSGLRQRMQASPLMDEVGFTRNLESAYREMWRRWCAASP